MASGGLEEGVPPALKANSTSTIFASSTISMPNIDEIVLSVTIALQCQMTQDEAADDEQRNLYPFFNETHYVARPPDYVYATPELEQIYSFLKYCFDVAQFSPECCIISLVYINRLTAFTNLPLTGVNWKPVLLLSLILAQKVWDDSCLANADFTHIYGALTPKDINFLERKLLELLQYKVSVSSSLYAKYYFELRTMCEENSRSFPLKPLSVVEAKRLEARSAASEQFMKESASKARSVTLEDVTATPSQTRHVLS